MTLAVRAVVELHGLANRMEELHREVLAFSVSHDHQAVRIYGHFPVIEGTKVTYWRYPLRNFDFTERKGLEKWTAYMFVKNIYDIWMPAHFKRICSAIDAIPAEQQFEASLVSGSHVSETTGLSQPLEKQNLVGAASSQPSLVDLQPITPDPSTQTEMAPPRKKKRGPT